MADVLVRNVDEKLLSRLKKRAGKNERSLQNELLHIFKTITEDDGMSDERTANRIKNTLRGKMYSDSAALLREDRRR